MVQSWFNGRSLAVPMWFTGCVIVAQWLHNNGSTATQMVAKNSSQRFNTWQNGGSITAQRWATRATLAIQ
eukprot:5491302-Lingulodinium_polyedra.AAC.1